MSEIVKGVCNQIATLNIGSTNVKVSFDEVIKKYLIKDFLGDEKLLAKLLSCDVILIRIVSAPKYQYQSDIQLIDNDFLLYFATVTNYAPLHNPQTFKIINILHENILKSKKKPKLFGVFDSSFHKNISNASRMYGINPKLALKYDLYRHGYHGLSYSYINSCLEKTKQYIVCHLGGGSSICAIKNGVSIATSMGFGTSDGLIMVKRAGDISAEIILFLIRHLNYSYDDVLNMVFNNSGLVGLTGSVFGDDVKAIVEDNNPLTKNSSNLAIDLYVNSIVNYISQYYFLLEGSIESIYFTGGIGENSEIIVKMIMDKILKIIPHQKFDIIKTNEELSMKNIYYNNVENG